RLQTQVPSVENTPDRVATAGSSRGVLSSAECSSKDEIQYKQYLRRTRAYPYRRPSPQSRACAPTRAIHFLVADKDATRIREDSRRPHAPPGTAVCCATASNCARFGPNAEPV